LAQSKAKLQSNCNNVTPSFRPFLNGNVSQKCLPSGLHSQLHFLIVNVSVAEGNLSYVRLTTTVHIMPWPSSTTIICYTAKHSTHTTTHEQQTT